MGIMDNAQAGADPTADPTAASADAPTDAPPDQPTDAGGSFTPKDPRQFIPPEQHDAVERVFVAGMKLMYSPAMASQRMQAVKSPDPAPKKIAENVTGLLLLLDQKAKGGIPVQAIFPAGVLLANEAANMLVQGGQDVTQDDYNQSLQLIYVQVGKKLGASDDDLMKGAQDALAKSKGGMPPDEQTADSGPAVPPDPTAAAPGAANSPAVPAGSPAAMPPQGAQ